MCLVKHLSVTFTVGLSMEIKNPAPASQARFPQLRVIECFCVEGRNKRNDHEAL